MSHIFLLHPRIWNRLKGLVRVLIEQMDCCCSRYHRDWAKSGCAACRTDFAFFYIHFCVGVMKIRDISKFENTIQTLVVFDSELLKQSLKEFKKSNTFISI